MSLIGLKMAKEVEYRKVFSCALKWETLLEAKMVNAIRRSKKLYERAEQTRNEL
jgi:hypothetical protein